MSFVSNNITITELTALEEWDAISQEWDELVVRCPEASVFNSFSFSRSLYTCLLCRRPSKLAMQTVKDEKGKLIGVAPMIRFKKWMTGFPVTIMSLMIIGLLLIGHNFDYLTAETNN